MRILAMASLWGVLLLLGSAEAAEGTEKPRCTGTFSSLSYHEEGGDLLGMELKIVRVRKGYQGALQIAEGGPSELMAVDVECDGASVKFTGPDVYRVYGGGVFEGTLDSKGIKGRFRFKGEDGDLETLHRGRGYWEQ